MQLTRSDSYTLFSTVEGLPGALCPVLGTILYLKKDRQIGMSPKDRKNVISGLEI